MCGIAGVVDLTGKRPIDREILARMTHALVHRGPDDSGFHFAPGVGLGHRRLSIIDLSPLGRQPLFNEDGTVCVTFNGEIYNFVELFERLIALGHKFRSRCDTEVIVHAWEEWGEDCVRHFQGMYAFAVWDEKNQTLFAARDRFGEKPFYYAALEDGQFIFASELKALLLHPGIRRDFDLHAVADYFCYGYVPDPRTIYSRIAKLPPAHSLTLRRGAVPPKPRAYWDVVFESKPVSSESAVCEELVERVRSAVGLRMTADVPLGAFLSGGVDSSAVVAMMSSLSRTPVNTCSMSFDDQAFDESRYAEQVAQRYQTNHFSRIVAVDDFDLLDRLSTFYDEPFADSSALPTYLVCSLAREKVTVALSGDGGDEIFGGYRRYYWHKHEDEIRSRLPAAARKAIFGTFGRMYPKMDWAPRWMRAKATLQNLARDSAEAYFNSVCAIPENVRHSLLSPALKREIGEYRPIDVMRGHIARAQTDDCLSQIQYADLKTYLPGDILTKVDRASMARSLEVRVPLLDHDLVQWLAAMPSSLKLRGREGKYVFKKALEPHLPHEVLYRPKMGFAVPLKSWFRGPLRQKARALVSDSSLRASDLFDMSALQVLVDEHQSGIADHSAAIWSLMMFDSFLRNVHQRTKPVDRAALLSPVATAL